LKVREAGTLNILVTGDGRSRHRNITYFRHQSLEYINAGTWKVTLEPDELGEMATD